MPLWNPVLLAEQVGTLAAFAEGRFILQCGIGDGYLASPSHSPADAKQLLAAYQAACERHGHSSTAHAIRRDVYVGSSEEDAEPVFNRVTAGGYRGFSSASLIWGSVSSVAEQFAALGA